MGLCCSPFSVCHWITCPHLCLAMLQGQDQVREASSKCLLSLQLGACVNLWNTVAHLRQQFSDCAGGELRGPARSFRTLCKESKGVAVRTLVVVLCRNQHADRTTQEGVSFAEELCGVENQPFASFQIELSLLNLDSLPFYVWVI